MKKSSLGFQHLTVSVSQTLAFLALRIVVGRFMALECRFSGSLSLLYREIPTGSHRKGFRFENIVGRTKYTGVWTDSWVNFFKLAGSTFVSFVVKVLLYSKVIIELKISSFVMGGGFIS
jgi:hypothetical protein